jgi:hypothetical protein
VIDGYQRSTQRIAAIHVGLVCQKFHVFHVGPIDSLCASVIRGGNDAFSHRPRSDLIRRLIEVILT